jgi:hypothetical protein
MPTFDQLTDRVKSELMGFTISQESMTVLTDDMLADDGTFAADPDSLADVSRGVAEIDDELVLVQKTDPMSGTVTVMGGTRGRGYLSTTAAPHTAGTLVTSAPAFPRARIKEAINQAIGALYPQLVVFKETHFPFNAAQIEYELPAEVRDVWYVTGRWVGPEKVSAPIMNWRYNPKAQREDFATQKSIQVFDFVTPGQLVKVVYAVSPTPLVAGSDDFAVTGYADRITDLVVWDVCKRLLPAQMSARLQLQAVEATERAPLVAARDIASAVQLYDTLYQTRLAEERAQMFQELPNYATYQGS